MEEIYEGPRDLEVLVGEEGGFVDVMVNRLDYTRKRRMMFRWKALASSCSYLSSHLDYL